MNNTISTADRGQYFHTAYQKRDADIDRARSEDIVDVIESYGVELKQRGKEFIGLCPFHDDHSPSFYVNREKGQYLCRSCEAKGDTIGFVMAREGVNFPEAVRKIIGTSQTGSSLPPMTEEQRRERAERMERQRREREAEEQARYAEAAVKACAAFEAAVPANENHSYLRRKLVKAHGIRVGTWEFTDQDTGEVRTVKNTLLVPVFRKVDGKGTICSLEGILPDGSKYGFEGGQRRDGYHVIGRPKVIDGRETLVIAEGYATAAAIHEATGHCVVMAFSAGNLLSIAKQVRDGKPDADIVIFGDRDGEALDSSVGTRKAVEAALAINARVVFPQWTGKKGRDANDIWVDGFTWGDTTFPGQDILEGCVKFATPPRSPAFMELMRECGIKSEDLAPANSTPGISLAAAGSNDADPSSPIAMGESGDLAAFWTPRQRVELVRVSDLFKDAGILRLQSLNYWEAWCEGKYDRSKIGNYLLQTAKGVGSLDVRNVPASTASPEVVEMELNLAMMHVKPSAYAIAKVLMAHPDWRGVVWFNEFAERIEARINPPCEGGTGRWTDNHDMLLGAWLSARYGVSVANTLVVAVVGLLAAADKRHPVRDYLNGLAWDGYPRLDTWLTAFAGCEDATYTRNVGAKTLIGAVARIMVPGVKFDTTLVLEGGQGLKKSTLINALAPNDEWYTDNLEGDLGSKDAAIGLAGKWLIEVPELASLNRTRVEVVKSFLSRKIDDYRSPHAKRNADHPRQCAFFGTINPEADGRYLNDTTGGRRFWPVTCVNTDIEGLKLSRDQLWAEAVARYSAGEQWWLTAEVEKLAKSEQADRQETNVWAEHVDRFMSQLPPDAHNHEWGGLRASQVKEITTSEIFATITGKQMTKRDLSDSKLISAALKAAGWAQKIGTRGKGRYWVRA